ncbi:MAG: hypothetical protein Q9196_005726 [Gyalolechia fulgens]
MSLPGHDGYRTPTVHDYERRLGEAVEQGEGGKEDKGPDRSEHEHCRPDILHWRKRIRHYTWTFFTMTMATGGIANVLYTGEPLPTPAKLPQESSRPGMFVSVGPSGFTVTGVIGMAESLSRNVDKDFMGDGQMASMILRVMANWMCLWIWGLAFWFFLVSVGAHWSCARAEGGFTFGMTWFSFIFPNTALITATFAVGKAFQSRGIQITGCVMTVFLLIAWFIVVGMMIRAIKLKQILWPQTGEDKDEGGFKAPATLERRETSKQKLSKTLSSRSNG